MTTDTLLTSLFLFTSFIALAAQTLSTMRKGMPLKILWMAELLHAGYDTSGECSHKIPQSPEKAKSSTPIFPERRKDSFEGVLTLL